MKIAVADASTLIILNRSGFLECLSKLFPRIKVPSAVMMEVSAGSEGAVLCARLTEFPWLDVVHVENKFFNLDYESLGRGEVEVIEIARSLPNAVALLDDRAARRWASLLGVPVVGTLGLVTSSLSHERNHSFDEVVSRLRAAGLYLDAKLVENVRTGLIDQGLDWFANPRDEDS